MEISEVANPPNDWQKGSALDTIPGASVRTCTALALTSSWGQMTLDDATAQFLEQMAASDSKPIHDMSPDEARALGGQLRQMYGQGPEIGSVLDATASGPGGRNSRPNTLTEERSARNHRLLPRWGLGDG